MWLFCPRMPLCLTELCAGKPKVLAFFLLYLEQKTSVAKNTGLAA